MLDCSYFSEYRALFISNTSFSYCKKPYTIHSTLHHSSRQNLSFWWGKRRGYLRWRPFFPFKNEVTIEKAKTKISDFDNQINKYIFVHTSANRPKGICLCTSIDNCYVKNTKAIPKHQLYGQYQKTTLHRVTHLFSDKAHVMKSRFAGFCKCCESLGTAQNRVAIFLIYLYLAFWLLNKNKYGTEIIY